MALTSRTVNLEANIRFDENGAFLRAVRHPTFQVLEAGSGPVLAEKKLDPVELTLAQLKTYVAAL